jgi:hypothetical protein
MVIAIGAGLMIWGALLPLTSVSAASGLEVVPAEVAEVAEVTEEIPEEILRTEIITEARSPLTGEPLNAAEYAQLQAELASPAGGNLVSQDLRYLVFLLQLRRAVRPILPFIK